MFQLDSREMMFAKHANSPDGTIDSASALAWVGESPMPRFDEDPLLVVEVEVGAEVLVLVGVGVLVAVEVEVCDGSGVCVVDVEVDDGLGAGACALLDEESALGFGLVGVVADEDVRPGRARSRFAATPVRAASAFAAAAAAAVFESCDAASALLRSPS